MHKLFIILGYGIPKDIFKDQNYNIYLKLVFNNIYDLTVQNNWENPILIFCGGQTDVIPPFKRTEAKEMIKFIRHFIAQNENLKKFTKDWNFIPENKSLNTVENLLNCHKIIDKKFKDPNIYIFFEKTRLERIKLLTQELFRKQNIQLIPIDFDTSSNRYLASEIIRKKEELAIKYDLWSLKNSSNQKFYHQAFKEKFVYLRKAGHKNQEKALQQWWKDNMNKYSVN